MLAIWQNRIAVNFIPHTTNTKCNCALELCFLGTHISDYPTISQGKTRIPGVNDGDEFELVHVSFCSQKKKENGRDDRFDAFSQ